MNSEQPNLQQSPPINTWINHFPKTIDPSSTGAIQEYLVNHSKPLYSGSRYHLPLVPLFPQLQSALTLCQKNGSLIRSLADAGHFLGKEQTGLNKLALADPSSAPRSISRILLLSNDCSHRLIRQVEHLLDTCSPRLAGLVMDCLSTDLSPLLYGKPGAVKLLLVTHKHAVRLLILSFRHATDQF
jgi:hypothetical protein